MAGEEDIAEPRVDARRRISLIWVVPVVAALIAGWLGYTTLSERGPTITIKFRAAGSLEAGKTRIKHKDVEMGVVDSITLAPDLSYIAVAASMRKEAAPFMNDGTRFWVVRPRIGAGGISGLETLVSGAYIEMDPGKGAATQTFDGLENPPAVTADVPGTAFILHAAKGGSLGPSSPIFFRGLRVGEVLGVDYTTIETDVRVTAFVRAPYDRLVYSGSRFWNASGISLTTGAAGFKLQMESLEAVLSGGIVFDTPDAARTGAPAPARTEFPLFDDAESAREAAFTIRVPYLVYFDGSVRGLEPGSPVEVRGIKIGNVVDIKLEFDFNTKSIRVPVTIEIERQRFVPIGTPAEVGSRPLLDHLVAQGLRAQLRSTSLLTGQLAVSLDFHPNARPATINYDRKYPELPTIPTDLEEITRSVEQVLDRLAALPIDELVEDMRATLRSFQGLAESHEVKQSLRSLDEALQAVSSIARKADAQVGPTLTAIATAANSADGAIKQAERTFASVEGNLGNNSPLSRDVAELMVQLKDAARAIRVLADYLSQHPEALVRGKGGRAGN